ncbi:MAG: protein phosphatase 2C domain-containing protein [Candidatus Omnitrophica bacterium]|nr:protein phosphatase 2C domain-containing protein [Candidatus Omnitrophota bacterium]MDD5672413.1 protein phosphatase 2C domain-containing protein [Candidatus Omnitrophota bacterium]
MTKIKTEIQYAAVTDIGRARPNNEDFWRAVPEMGLYMVSDGMGGRASGEVAAEMVIELLPILFKHKLPADLPLNTPRMRAIVNDTLLHASLRIFEAGEKNPSHRGMGATVVFCLFRGREVLTAHVGDSRAYLFRAHRLTRLTKDHSVFQLLVDQGEAVEEEASGHPARFQLTQCMGHGMLIEPGLSVMEWIPQDRILLASDGLFDMIDDGTIEKTLQKYSEPSEACKELVAAANNAGGKDNITALVIDFP